MASRFGFVSGHFSFFWLMVSVLLRALPLPFCSWFLFPRLLLLSVPELFVSAPFDQCDQLEEERAVAQSKASKQAL